ncbi:NB-ARC domain-containing protein [Crossiella sp. CA-258035]|uniref:ATP-binding protein n=1 Tax=Crossiella sp. CA-258035 TaxID=2981138 RepID=UPI0024BCF4D4|nr:NB-ARC domain-containing protein [Crossiella sp. CA-258035]WHT21879.1 NB-ARC domain-containing protein [Crossiella sp. CA-258035]
MVERPGARNEISGTVMGNVVQGRDIAVSLPTATPVAVTGLPAQAVFVGRRVELGRLANALDPAGANSPGGSVVVSAVAGLAGVGKTTLAVRAAHDAIAAGWFPGGVLMVDLRGYDAPERQVLPSAALASLLGALGTPSEHIPADQSDRERLWRSRLAQRHASGQRMLIVLDNASSSDRVRPLLPGTDGHRVVITSRHSLADLDGARLLDVDVLSAEQAIDLLQQELVAAHPGDDRVRADPGAADRLGQLCGGLPLAVRIAAALLGADPDQPVSELTEALAAEHNRLEELEYDGSLSVRAAFDLSYQHLGQKPAQLFRLLALNPGPEISTEAAAALANRPTVETRRLVGQLRRAHLLLPGSARGRWRMHDLVRVYATERISQDPAKEPALERLINYYLTNTQEAGRHFGAHTQHAKEGGQVTTWKEAIEWLDTEYPNLLTTVTLAHNTGRSHCALHLPLALYPYFHLRKHWTDWVATHRLALLAARRLRDRQGEGFALINLGSALRDQAQFDGSSLPTTIPGNLP